MSIPTDIFYCPETGEALTLHDSAYVSRSGKRWPIIDGIPRFVESDSYVDTFSFEWNTHFDTQLDFITGKTYSEEALTKKTGLTAEQIRGKLVLDAGVGAGRFADVLSRWGAEVVGVDLSYAVRAAYRNLHDRPNVLIAQADIGKLPFQKETFDYIVSIGVLHHTPDTRLYFSKLVPLLKRGGEICIWVYPNIGDNYVKRAEWIRFTNKIPPRWFYEWCRCVVPFFLKHINSPFVRLVETIFPFSNQGMGLEQDILDTFDGYSPKFHGIHSAEEVVQWFCEAGLEDISVFPEDTAVRGRRPGPPIRSVLDPRI